MSAASDDLGAAEHIGEDAELYALGALNRHERARVAAHAASCAACARSLEAAMTTVAALDDAYVEPIEPPASLARRIASSARVATMAQRAPLSGSRAVAIAASVALAIGLGSGALLERHRNTQQTSHDSAIVATLADAHFLHVSLQQREPGVPRSKAIYARDGSWLYVVIDGANCACHVRARTKSGNRDLGAPDTHGTTATLFTRDVALPQSIELVNASGHLLANATLVYPTR